MFGSNLIPDQLEALKSIVTSGSDDAISFLVLTNVFSATYREPTRPKISIDIFFGTIDFKIDGPFPTHRKNNLSNLGTKTPK